ncbi:MAG: hypothetical protein N2379_08470 [Verrucomicrobiae bacterium]|nr:hypothetical protein [Verrucomicrobiae bacterium]
MKTKFVRTGCIPIVAGLILIEAQAQTEPVGPPQSAPGSEVAEFVQPPPVVITDPEPVVEPDDDVQTAPTAEPAQGGQSAAEAQTPTWQQRGTQPVQQPPTPASTRANPETGSQAASQQTSARTELGTVQTSRQANDAERGIRLNFRGAPLELVLDYLSEAAGFIIKPEVDVKGKVDVWSAHPLTKDEAVELLNSVLSKNGYAVLRDGRTLTIVTKEEARRRSIPVRRGYEPESIPKTDEIVTQIIPVRFINAVQLAKDLQPLIPSQATITANQGGNAIVITDTQANIRRIAEIIKALDTSVASVSAVRVFALRYADAKTLASIIRDVFQTPTTSSTDVTARFFARFRGGPFGAPQESSGESEAGGRPGASRVTAVADERSNSLVVSAPEDLMPTIEELVKAVDVNVEDITELRVFKLKHADPQEMAELLTNLFPDETTTQSSQRGGFGRFFAFGPPGMQQAGADTSERMRKQGRVIAVADPRTGSVVVTASRELMRQIERMIEELDADPARKQKVFVFDVENTDPAQVQAILQNLFSSQSGTTTGTRTQTRQTTGGNQSGTRQGQQQGSTAGSGTFGGTGVGTGTGIRTSTGR